MRAIAALLIAVTFGATATGHAAELLVGPGLITDLVTFTSIHPHKDVGSVKLQDNQVTCNGALEFAVPLTTQADMATFSLLMAAKLAGKKVRLAIDDQLITGDRCTVRAVRVY